LYGRPGERLEPFLRAGRAALGVVVVDERGLLVGHVGHELLELHPDQPPLLAELDAGALDLLGHAASSARPAAGRRARRRA
jgi:hypothetical protein